MNRILFFYLILVTLLPKNMVAYLSVSKDTDKKFCYLTRQNLDCKLWNQRLCKFKIKEDCYNKKPNGYFCLSSSECSSGNYDPYKLYPRLVNYTIILISIIRALDHLFDY
jgi:hypothetical protein